MQGFPPRLLAISEKCPQGMLQRDAWTIKDFVLVREVGSGAASTVYYALCRKSTLPCAIKMYLKSKLSRLNRKQVEREISIHSSLNHPHIIDFYAAFEDEERIYLVQEYAAGGDLFDDVKRRGGRMTEQEVVQQVLYPYLSALLYLHRRGIIHRDIKPENTVFSKEKVMKVTDFGLAIDSTQERPVTRLGTLDYMAPEVLRCPDKHNPEDNKDRVDLEYDISVDSWAMGVLAYELIVGRPPFGMSCREATMRAISNASPSFPEWMSAGAADFIRCALQRTAARRSSIAQLLQHPWVLAHTRQRLISEGDAMLAAEVSYTSSMTASSTSSAYSIASLPGALNAGQQQRLAEAAMSFSHTAAVPTADDLRPAKRALQRCCSVLHGAAGAGGGHHSTGGAVYTLGQPPAGQAPSQKLHDVSYWVTNGDGFSHDPLASEALQAHLQAQLLQGSGSFTAGSGRPATAAGGPNKLSLSSLGGGGGFATGSNFSHGTGVFTGGGGASMALGSNGMVSENNSMAEALGALNGSTAASFYKGQLDDIKNGWEGGRPHGSRLLSKSLSRSFCLKHSTKRRTPDTSDWDLPAQPSGAVTCGNGTSAGVAPSPLGRTSMVAGSAAGTGTGSAAGAGAGVGAGVGVSPGQDPMLPRAPSRLAKMKRTDSERSEGGFSIDGLRSAGNSFSGSAFAGAMFAGGGGGVNSGMFGGVMMSSSPMARPSAAAAAFDQLTLAAAGSESEEVLAAAAAAAMASYGAMPGSPSASASGMSSGMNMGSLAFQQPQQQSQLLQSQNSFGTNNNNGGFVGAGNGQSYSYNSGTSSFVGGGSKRASPPGAHQQQGSGSAMFALPRLQLMVQQQQHGGSALGLDGQQQQQQFSAASMGVAVEYGGLAASLGLRSHPINSPLNTPFMTPLNSPARAASFGRSPANNFNALLDSMDLDPSSLGNGGAGGSSSQPHPFLTKGSVGGHSRKAMRVSQGGVGPSPLRIISSANSAWPPENAANAAGPGPSPHGNNGGGGRRSGASHRSGSGSGSGGGLNGVNGTYNVGLTSIMNTAELMDVSEVSAMAEALAAVDDGAMDAALLGSSTSTNQDAVMSRAAAAANANANAAAMMMATAASSASSVHFLPASAHLSLSGAAHQLQMQQLQAQLSSQPPLKHHKRHGSDVSEQMQLQLPGSGGSVNGINGVSGGGGSIGPWFSASPHQQQQQLTMLQHASASCPSQPVLLRTSSLQASRFSLQATPLVAMGGTSSSGLYQQASSLSNGGAAAGASGNVSAFAAPSTSSFPQQPAFNIGRSPSSLNGHTSSVTGGMTSLHQRSLGSENPAAPGSVMSMLVGSNGAGTGGGGNGAGTTAFVAAVASSGSSSQQQLQGPNSLNSINFVGNGLGNGLGGGVLNGNSSIYNNGGSSAAPQLCRSSSATSHSVARNSSSPNLAANFYLVGSGGAGGVAMNGPAAVSAGCGGGMSAGPSPLGLRSSRGSGNSGGNGAAVGGGGGGGNGGFSDVTSGVSQSGSGMSAGVGVPLQYMNGAGMGMGMGMGSMTPMDPADPASQNGMAMHPAYGKMDTSMVMQS